MMEIFFKSCYMSGIENDLTIIFRTRASLWSSSVSTILENFKMAAIPIVGMS